MVKKAYRISDDETIKWKKDGKLYCCHFELDEFSSDPRKEFDHLATMACWWNRYKLGDELPDKSPLEFLQRLVRENVSEQEFFEAVKAGKLPGIRLEPNPENKELFDIYTVTQWQSPLGNSDPAETLDYEGVSAEGVMYALEDDLTMNQCMTLLHENMVFLPLWIYEHSGLTISCGDRHYPYNDTWDSGQAGWIVATKDKLVKESVATEANWREKAIDIMKAEVREYDMYLTNEVYGYTVYEATPPEDEDEKPDWEDTGNSCWGFYGDDIFENGMADAADIIDIIESGEFTSGRATHETRTILIL